MKTPYAVLMVKPTDTPEFIQQQFHQLSRQQHPDALGGVVGDRWVEITQAYGLIKTEAKRDEWERSRAKLSGICKRCRGVGVVGARMAGSKLRECEECKGEGRVK